MKVVAECIGPENHWRTISIAQRALAEPRSECLCGKRRHVALLGDAAKPLRQLRRQRRAADKIHQPRRDASHSGPALDQSHGVGGAGTRAVFIVVGQKFRFVGGHVHVDGALALAGLAGKTKIERIFQVFILPALFERFTAQHFKEQARASASGMLLFARGHVAGTHGATVIFAALAHSDAAQRGLRKMSVVFREPKISFDRRGPVGGAETQIFVERIGVNLFARIHLPVRGPICA